MLKEKILLVAGLFLFSCLPVFAQSHDMEIRNNVNLRTAKVISEVPSISVHDFKVVLDKQKRNYSIIDVRSSEEFASGRIAYAINVPRGQAEWGVPSAVRDPDRKIFVYCRSGNRSAYVVKMLLEVGYTDVVNVSGGFRSWAKAGYPFYNMHGESVLVKDSSAKHSN